MKKILWMVLVGGVLLGCSGSTKKSSEGAVADVQEQQVEDIHRANNSLDYQGTYAGTLPDNEGERVAVNIELTDSTYILRVNSENENAKVSEQMGEYTWNAEGNTITLAGVEGTLSTYFVAENHLRQLNENGKQYVGDEASSHVLHKR